MNIYRSIRQVALYVCALLTIVMVTGCSRSVAGDEEGDDWSHAHLNREDFRRMVDSTEVDLFVLRNDSMEMAVTNFGARLVSLMVTGQSGEMCEIVAGADSLAAIIANPSDLNGAVAGRYSATLKDDKAPLGDKTLKLNSSRFAWANRPWRVREATDSTVVMQLVSPDGEGGLPGLVTVQVEYRLHDYAGFSLVLTAVTDSPTLIDASQTLDVNLAGTDVETNAAQMRLTLNSNQHLVRDSIDGNYNGETLMTIWTPMDFRKPRRIANLSGTDFWQVKWRGGLNSYFVLPDYGHNGVQPAMTLYSPETGIEMSMATSHPGVHLKVLRGSKVASITPHNFPDAPNHRGWGRPAVLNPDEVYRHVTTYTFRIR